MSEIVGIRDVRKRHALTLFLITLTFIYAVIFAVVARQYAYAEPGGFPAFYTAGLLARSDLHGLYNRHLQDVFHPGNLGTGYFFHLPYELVLLVPLSYLPQVTAYVVWAILNLVCLLCVALILRRHFPNFALLIPFAFAPTLSLLLNGQDIGIVTLVIALAFDRFVCGKDLQAGLLLCLGLFKFPLVIPLAAILGPRYWKVLAGFSLSSIPLLGLSAAVMGGQGIDDYLALTHGTDAKEDPAILIALRGVIEEIFGHHVALVISASIICVVVAASMRSARLSAFCIAVIATVLVSWHAHFYDAVLLLIPMAWMLESDRNWMRFAVIALLVGTAPILVSYTHTYFLGIFLCVLFGVLLWNPMHDRSIAHESSPARSP